MADAELIKEILKKKDDVEEITLNKLKITNWAFQKAKLYAEKIKDVHGDLECYFFLITPRENNDRIVRDVYLPQQKAHRGGVRLSEEDIIESGKFLKERGYRILGWCHSHGDMSTFHSGTDDDNIFIVLNEIAADNNIEIENERNMFKDEIITDVKKDQLEVFDKERQISLILDYKGKFKGRIRASKLKAPIRVGFAYSLVINAIKNSKPYAEVAMKEFCPLYLRDKEDQKIKVPVEIIKEKNKKELKIKDIKKEIKSKIVPVSGFFDWMEREKMSKGGAPCIETVPELEEGRTYSVKEVQSLLYEQQRIMSKREKALLRWMEKYFGEHHMLTRFIRFWMI